MLPLVLPLLLTVFFAYCTVRIARQKGRRPVLWAVIGACLGIFGVVIAALVPSKLAAPADV